jgi:hypothetical protein
MGRQVAPTIIKVENSTYISYRELERIHLAVHVLDLEHAALVLTRPSQMDLDFQSFTTKEDICESRIFHLWQSSLLVEVECDIPHVGLDLGHRELEVVLALVGYRFVRTKFEIVVGVHGDDAKGSTMSDGVRPNTSDMTHLGRILLPSMVRFSMTRSIELSVYSIRGIG